MYLLILSLSTAFLCGQIKPIDSCREIRFVEAMPGGDYVTKIFCEANMRPVGRTLGSGTTMASAK
jgi:hypothetical protein